jgi:hypothetical protein
MIFNREVLDHEPGEAAPAVAEVIT